MQRQIPTIPLMLEEGYRPDGWLGMLIGTKLWYAFYGGVLADDAQFVSRVDALIFDLGDRGRDSPGAKAEDSPAEAGLRAELQLLKLMPLRARALEGGVPEEAADEAMEADNPKAALVELVVVATKPDPEIEQQLQAAEAGLRAELQLLKLMPLQARALESRVPEEAVEDAMEAENPKAALVELVVGRLGMA
jgi:hypothetical protein